LVGVAHEHEEQRHHATVAITNKGHFFILEQPKMESRSLLAG
jgi:hypothetical protein